MDLPGVKQVLTTAELRRLDVSKTVIRERVRARRWQRLFEGVIYVASGPIPKEAWWMAGVKAGGEGAALCDVSAVSLLGLITPVVLPVHVALPYPRNRRSRPTLQFRRLSALTTTTTTYGGIPVVVLERVLADLPQPLRDRATNTARVKGLLKDGAPVSRSNAEASFAAKLRRAGIAGWEQNALVEGLECDFVWRAERLVVEVDGPHHLHEPQRSIDRSRDARLQLAGYVVLRVDAGEPDLPLVQHTLRALR